MNTANNNPEESKSKKNLDSDLPRGNSNNLKYNKKENSFELDIEGGDPEYQHPDPYDTTAVNGEDMNSDYDEANPYVGDEYDKDASLERDVDILGMHITDDDFLRVDAKDADLGKTSEDNRNDLDEEGYPKFKR